MLRNILIAIQLLSSFAIIGLVLLQRGKGADAGAGFGAGASGTVFGARGASTALSRATAIFAAVFMINSLLLAYVGSHSGAAPARTILDEAAAPAKNTLSVPAAPGNATVPASGAAPASGAPADTTAPAPVPAGGPSPNH